MAPVVSSRNVGTLTSVGQGKGSIQNSKDVSVTTIDNDETGKTSTIQTLNTLKDFNFVSSSPASLYKIFESTPGNFDVTSGFSPTEKFDYIVTRDPTGNQAKVELFNGETKFGNATAPLTAIAGSSPLKGKAQGKLNVGGELVDVVVDFQAYASDYTSDDTWDTFLQKALPKLKTEASAIIVSIGDINSRLDFQILSDSGNAVVSADDSWALAPRRQLDGTLKGQAHAVYSLLKQQ